MKKNSSERALFLYASHNGTVILSTPAVFATTVQRYQETTLNNQGIFNQRKGELERVFPVTGKIITKDILRHSTWAVSRTKLQTFCFDFCSLFIILK